MSTASIIKGVQVMLNDAGSAWSGEDFILGWLKKANKILESRLESLDLAYDTAVTVLPGVPAGTTDLSAYQDEGQPLASLVLPTALEWRAAGEDDLHWRSVPPVDKVVDVANNRGIRSYEWRGAVVYLSASVIDVDLRIRYEALPALLDSDSATFIKGMDSVLETGTAWLIEIERAGEKSVRAGTWEKLYEAELSTIEARLVKGEAQTPRRMAGRRSSVGGPVWRPPTG